MGLRRNPVLFDLGSEDAMITAFENRKAQMLKSLLDTKKFTFHPTAIRMVPGIT